MTTAGANSGSALQLSQSGTLSNPANTPQSDVTGVTFRGSDGYRQCNYWANDVYNGSASNINFTNDDFVGPGSSSSCPAYGGTGIALVGSSGAFGVVYNVSQSTFQGLEYGIYYGSYSQGLTVTGGTNLSENNVGIYVPNGVVGTTELVLANSQCANNVACVQDLQGVVGELISNNLIYANDPPITTNGSGISAVCAGCSIIGNTFTVASGSGVGVDITGGTGGVIAGNTFAGLTTGVELSSSLIQVSNNHYGSIMGTTNGTNLTSASGGNIVTGAPVFAASAVVSGAVAAPTTGLVRLTVPSTSHFVDGDMVDVAGVGGVSYVSASVITTITVVSITQMDLNSVPFVGAYSGGGVVTAL
jgi:hypothetical protein